MFLMKPSAEVISRWQMIKNNAAVEEVGQSWMRNKCLSKIYDLVLELGSIGFLIMVQFVFID